MKLPFFTIGHSNRSFDEFIELLTDAEVGLVVDIRKITRSRANPQFNQETLPQSLSAHGISYEHVAALGGRRGKSKSVPRAINAFWTHESFHNYADYAMSDEFRAGLERLIKLGRKRCSAMMCSEAVWWRCHRRIVTDHLLARGESVVHVMAKGRLEPAKMTSGAVVQPDGTVVYPAVDASDSL